MQAALQALEDTPVMTASEARAFAVRCFPGEWPSVEDALIEVSRLSGGTQNLLTVVRRRHTTCGSQEPAVLLIRKYPPEREECPQVYHATSIEETLVAFEAGRKGWGPKLYDTFKGGRVEEYVEAHPLTPVEASSKLISEEIARMYARFASLEVPLYPGKVLDILDAAARDLKAFRTCQSKLQEIFSAFARPGAENIVSNVFETDWEAETRWVRSLFAKYGCQSAVTHFDSNFMNILVREDEHAGKTMLIDYETTMSGFRGIDIGSHFAEHMFSWTHPENQLNGYPFPPLEARKQFCKTYLEESAQLGICDDSGAEQVKHLLTESQIGTLFFVVRTLVDVLKYPEPASLDATMAIVDVYHQTKAEFLSVPNLA
ncbi:choline kinase [Pseudozyma hubeiensis SY62]|uniref:Choline kinase n=1 Tax=Pseudozyma hubeiensis (strain SY62) TaxID=1305764 RepID=R9P2Z4_PSEHS|nr:choline kinase [Pseudozyma hubeiensis SY62]GAC95798.1 choline kinase [Pseudozyma hubeiensis SY62]